MIENSLYLIMQLQYAKFVGIILCIYYQLKLYFMIYDK